MPRKHFIMPETTGVVQVAGHLRAAFVMWHQVAVLSPTRLAMLCALLSLGCRLAANTFRMR